MLGPTTKPPRRFRIFHRTRCREENEGGGLGRDTIFAGQSPPDVMMRVGTAAFLNTEKGGVRPSSSYSKKAKTPIGYRRPLSSPSALSLSLSAINYWLIVV
jgi:hypothetical protein